MKKETYEMYCNILNRKKELQSSGKKMGKIRIILGEEFLLSDAMIQEVIYSHRTKEKMDKYLREVKNG
jgi:hypothetical protein